LHNAVGKSFHSFEAKRHFTTPRCNEGYAFPDERRHDGDDELINCVLIKEGRDDLPSAHHPDVLASLLAKALGKGSDRLGDEMDLGGRGRRRGRATKNLMKVVCAEARTHLPTQGEVFTTEILRID